MLNDENSYCRVCGYQPGFLPWGDDGKSPTYEICACCGVEYGYEDCTIISVKAYREKWVAEACVWFDRKLKPQNWIFKEQFENVPQNFR